MFSRLVEGHFPNIPSLLPEYSRTVITLDTAQLLLGVDRACLFSSEGKKNMIHFEMKDGKRINISSDSSEIGIIEETQSVKEMTGEANLQIALDGRFLMEVLKVIDEKEIRLSFDGAMRPVKIEPVHSSYLHLLSPVRSW
ncbi:DNA polymerase III subunit beta [Bacillus sp. FSL H8-0547]